MKDALKILWIDLDRIINEESLSCRKNGGCDGKCCSSQNSGIEPTVLPIEVQLIKDFLANNKLFRLKNNIGKCSFLSEDHKCLIYDVRPIACRTHFCSNDKYESINNQKISNKVVLFLEDNKIDYEQREFISRISFHY